MYLRRKIDALRDPDARCGFKLSRDNVRHENRICTCPYIDAVLLKRFLSSFRPEEQL